MGVLASSCGCSCVGIVVLWGDVVLFGGCGKVEVEVDGGGWRWISNVWL